MKKTFKIFFTIAFSVIMFSGIENVFAETSITATTWTELVNGIALANANKTEEYNIEIANDMQADSLITIDGSKVTLSGTGTMKGYTVNRSLILVTNGGTLTYDGPGLTEHDAIGTGNPEAIQVNKASTLIFKSGKIFNNKGVGPGAGIEITDSTLYMSGGELYRNVATQNGGAIGLNGAKAYITGGKIYDNQSAAGSAISFTNSSTATIENVEFYDNVNSGITIFVSVTSTLEMSNCYIHNNKNIAGSATIYIQKGSKVTVKDSIIENNEGERGGAFFATGANTVLDIYNCTITGNSSTERGGAFGVRDNAVVNLHSGTVTGNSSLVGGAVGVEGTATFNMEDGLIEDNNATTNGGAISLISPTGTSAVANITGGIIRNNAATNNGNGVYVSAGSNFNIDKDTDIATSDDVYLDGTNTVINVLGHLNNITKVKPISVTPSDETMSLQKGNVGNQVVNYYSEDAALNADVNKLFIPSEYTNDINIMQSDIAGEENYLFLGRRIVNLKFVTNNNQTIDDVSLNINDIILDNADVQNETSTLTTDGYIFEGWYTDESLTTKLTEDSYINDDMILYAKWIKGENPNTGDNLAIYIVVMIISLIVLIGSTILIFKTRKKNKTSNKK